MFTLIEGQFVLDDHRTWRIFLQDGETGKAEQLNIQSHGGTVSFGNPTIELVEISGRRAIVVTLFVPQEGARSGEAGELIYYKDI